MKLSIFLIFLITVLLSNNNLFVLSNSSSSSDCLQSVKSVSEVNPYIIDSLVVIKGVFCLNNASEISVNLNAPYANSNVAVGLGCGQVTIDTLGQTITCRLSDALPSTQATNYTYLTTVIITTPIPVPMPSKTSSLIGIGPTPVLGIRGYLFTNAQCPKNCNSNGICDVGMTCRCNEGYASFDCSQKVSNTSSVSSPFLVSYDTFGLKNKVNEIDIRLSHVVANSLLTGLQFTYQQQFSSVPTSNTTNTQNEMSYSKISNSSAYWITSLWCNIAYSQTKSPSFNYVNYKGAYMPQSSLSALMTIVPTIYSESSTFPTQIFNTSWTNASYSFIIEFSVQGLVPDDMTTSISDVANTVSFTSEKTKTLLVFSLSDIYSFNGTTVGGHANLTVPSSSYTSNLVGSDSSSYYLSINIPQTNTPVKSGNYTIQLMVNAYDLIPTSKFPPWKIGLIIGCVVGGIIFIGVIVAVVRYRKHKHSYHHIQDHHHHHHHSESYH